MITEDGSGGIKGASKPSTSKMSSSVTDDDAGGDGDGLSDEDGMDNGDKRGNKAKSPKRRASTVDRRRERNRVLARKTRLRKKFFFEVSAFCVDNCP